MKVTIKQILESQQKTSKAGKPYTVTTFQGDDDKLYKDVFGKFEVGQIVEGEWKETDYGTKFEVARGASTNRFTESPEKQASIERQHALSQAVTYVLGKGEEVTGKHVIQVATFFHAFTSGKSNVTTTPEELLSIMNGTKTVEDTKVAPSKEIEGKVEAKTMEVKQGDLDEEEIDLSDVDFGVGEDEQN